MEIGGMYERLIGITTVFLTLSSTEVGYMLRRWGVDCSVYTSLNPEKYHLALQNIESLANA
jgi:hypothetical protein